jgi:hypothetical protein
MDYNKKIYVIALLGMVIYVIFISLAIITYAGGTMDNPTAQGYNFFANTFSDTGRLVAHNGENNLIAMIFFTIAYASISILFLPFYHRFPMLFERPGKAHMFSHLGSIFGSVASFSFLTVLFFPADVLRGVHMLLAIIAYIATFLMAASYSITLYLGKLLPTFYGWIFIAYAIFFFAMLLMKLIGILIEVRVLLCTGQKLGRIANLISFSALIYGLWVIED